MKQLRIIYQWPIIDSVMKDFLNDDLKTIKLKITNETEIQSKINNYSNLFDWRQYTKY